jgi:hypothetical protein
MMRWLRIAVMTLAAIAALSYLLDWAVFRMRGSPTLKITVSHFVSAPLKNNKQEIDFIGSEDTPCSVTLYPQAGMAPCWYVRKHRNQVTNY